MTRSLRSVVQRWAVGARRRIDPDRRIVAAEFDRAYYLSLNPDVAATRTDPLGHFMAHGWREGRDPSADFSIREYLHNNPDVAAAGINPFAHYLQVGRAQGRIATEDLGFRYRIIARQAPVETQLATAAAATKSLKTDAPERLIAAFAGSRTGLTDLHITFSHDDYRGKVGGVQLCLQQESTRVAELGRDHLHLHPPVGWPVLRVAGEEAPLTVVLNGETAGTYPPAAIVTALTRAAGGRSGARTFAIHSLLGHRVDETVAILAAAGLRAGFFWLHDYTSLCAGFHLLRNGVEDCAAPPPDSAACGICIYGPWRARHLDAHGELFRRLQLTVVSPAAPTLTFWRGRWDFPAAGHVVHPHASLAPRSTPPPPAAEGPLRVAYVGLPLAYKGWPVFRELVLKHAQDPRYAFFHLGAQVEPGLPAEFQAVSVTSERPRAMQEALEALEIDVVLFWALGRETFSFAVYEAVAAGCAVVTGPDSGNVAAVVGEGGRGWVAPDETALEAAFASGELARLSRARRKPIVYDLKLSGMTVDLLPARAEA
jgi:hypothetical protein